MPIAHGIFNVYLGSVVPLDDELFVGQDIYLGVTVGSDSEMTPRLRLGSVLYAFTANRDGDGDSYGDPNNGTTSFTVPAGYVSNNLDCDDGGPDVHLGAAEIGCDGMTDETIDGDDGLPCTEDMCAGGETEMASPGYRLRATVSPPLSGAMGSEHFGIRPLLRTPDTGTTEFRVIVLQAASRREPL